MRLSAPALRRRLCAVATSLAAAIAALGALAGHPAPAAARAERTLAYPRDQAWPTAVRFLVVDEHVKVTEKDADAGYAMFELREDGKVFRGSLELVPLVRDGRTVVRFVLQIAERPSWVEIAMLTRLETKLRVELGSPSPAPDAPKKKDDPSAPKPDAPKPDEPKPDDHAPPISPTP